MLRAAFRGMAACGAAVAFALVACSSTSSTSPAPTANVTYYRDVKPILDAKCVGCHTTGSFAPFALTSPSDAVTHRSAMKAATTARTMPPWPPGKSCTEYIGDRSLSEAQIATLAAWGDGAGVLGDPNDYKAPVMPPKVLLSRTDATITMPEAYTPVLSPDEYRCFLMDWPVAEDTHITGLAVDPGVIATAHHALVYVVPPDQVAAYQALDAAEPGAGYSCFAGPNNGSGDLPLQVGGWVPGTFGVDYPAETGIKVLAGSKLVIQMHYNTQYAKPAPDKTSVRVKVDKDVAKEAYIMPFADPAWITKKTMAIPAGAPDTMFDFSYDAAIAVNFRTKGAIKTGEPFTVHSAALHQHLHGTHSRLEVIASGGGSQCLLDIPNWDFHWQGSYGFVQPKVVKPGDQFRIECHWDNSAKRQPLGPDGRPIAPQPLNWGEGTNDEMCVGFMYLTQ